MNNIKDQSIEEINENLDEINRKLGNFWFAFAKGLLTGFGSVLGAGLAIIVIGWVLNVIGVIPAFERQADQWREAFQQTKQDTKSILPEDGQ